MIREGIGGTPQLSEEEAKRVVDALRKLRNERYGGNGAALAKALGRSPSGLSQLLSGKTKPSWPTCRAVAAMLGTTADALVAGTAGGGNLPNRGAAAEICRAGGVPDDAIAEVEAEDHPEDRPVLWWIDRMRARATLMRDNGWASGVRPSESGAIPATRRAAKAM